MRKNINKIIISAVLLAFVAGNTGCGENTEGQFLKISHSATRIKTPKWTPPAGAYTDQDGYVVDEDGTVIGIDPSIPYMEVPHDAAG